MQKLCMIGLGNPGEKYNNTRHNVGSDWVRKAIASFGVDFKYSQKDKAFYATTHDSNIEWIIPDCYVNESGQAIKKILKNKRFPLDKIFIIHDDLDLPTAEIRVKEGGGHGGHNGLRDLIKHFSSNVMRIRVGIDHPGHRDLVTSWVLTKFSKNDRDLLDEAFIKFLRAIELIYKDKIAEAQKFLHTQLSI